MTIGRPCHCVHTIGTKHSSGVVGTYFEMVVTEKRNRLLGKRYKNTKIFWTSCIPYIGTEYGASLVGTNFRMVVTANNKRQEAKYTKRKKKLS